MCWSWYNFVHKSSDGWTDWWSPSDQNNDARNDEYRWVGYKSYAKKAEGVGISASPKSFDIMAIYTAIIIIIIIIIIILNFGPPAQSL